MNRQISPLGQSQLAAWENVAKGWLLIPTWRDERPSHTPAEWKQLQLHLCCHKCNISVYAASEQGISPDYLLAATVAHLRNFHREYDPDA